ncbi:MAG: indolepyruvate oxidoreductase subunit beta [Clostridia bacterium]|nr:indolepyruvate oxidoreductase subunit beta [Clostridia bacterium]MBQ6171388.1 indolepyruvate oxidoreductase subunit beta [Clostridia bacterium]
MKTTNIMIVGVGGQGTLLASRLLGHILPGMGYDVKISEVHGMSQRGGSVVTFVRYGSEVCSPIVEKGEADYIIAFEQLEAARWLSYLKKDGKLITSSQQIDPMPVITGVSAYPESLPDRIKQAGVDELCIDVLSLAKKAGSSKAVNVVLLGVFAKLTGLSPDLFKEAIDLIVKEKFRQMNKTAFDLGYAVLQ